MNLSKLRYLPIPIVLSLVAYLADENRGEIMVRKQLAGKWREISAGGEHTCAVDRDQKITCWGKSTGGRTTPPQQVQLTGISAGGGHSCGLTADGAAVCWGEDYKGATRPPAGPFVQLSAGWDYTCGVKEDRTVACWGWNGQGQAAPPAGKFASVAAGALHSCGVKVDGAIACWGRGVEGQCDAPAGRFKQAVVGKCHGCGLRTDGSVTCWGCNPPGVDTPNGRYTPPGDRFTKISAGHLHLCGLRADGTVNCWGHNALGESDDPRGTFRQVTTGYFHSCGIHAGGSITCWGWASHTTRSQARQLQDRKINHDSVALQRHTCPFEGLGLLYLSQGRQDRAAGHFASAVKVSPDQEPRQYIYLARIRINQGRLADAEKLLAKAKTLSPKHGEIRLMLQRITRIRNGEPDRGAASGPDKNSAAPLPGP